MANILIIDDDREIRRAFRFAVENAGHSVRTASNGREGLRELREHPFDLVVTDIVMPDIEGIETIRTIRAERPDIPIIAVSGGGEYASGETYLSIARSLGANAGLKKPVSVRELNRLITELLTSPADGG